MKDGVYGIDSITLAPVVAGGFPDSAAWSGPDAFSFRAIVKDSVQFNDQAASTNDIEVEDSDSPYATLDSSVATKGFTVNTYDLSEAAYIGLMSYTKDEKTGYYNEPVKTEPLFKAARIVTKKLGDFPSKTFEWANMRVSAVKSGTIGKSGFPNLTVTLLQQANANEAGALATPARWAYTDKLIKTT